MKLEENSRLFEKTDNLDKTEDSGAVDGIS